MQNTMKPEVSDFYTQILKRDYLSPRPPVNSHPILTSADVLGARFLHLSAEGSLERKRQEESLEQLTKCSEFDKNCVFCIMVDLLKAQQNRS